MKPAIVNIILLLCMIIAGCLFTMKFKEPVSYDKINSSLVGARKYLSYNSHIGFAFDNDVELSAIVNYLLAPVYLDSDNESKQDTSLIILNKDKNAAELTGQFNILWQNKDDKYQYLLITHHAKK